MLEILHNVCKTRHSVRKNYENNEQLFLESSGPLPPESNVGLQESSGLYRLNTKVAKFYGNKLALASKSIIYPVFRQRGGFFLQLWSFILSLAYMT